MPGWHHGGTGSSCEGKKIYDANYWEFNSGTRPSLSNHCNSFEDRVPVDFIYGYPIVKWVEDRPPWVCNLTCGFEIIPLGIWHQHHTHNHNWSRWYMIPKNWCIATNTIKSNVVGVESNRIPRRHVTTLSWWQVSQSPPPAIDDICVSLLAWDRVCWSNSDRLASSAWHQRRWSCDVFKSWISVTQSFPTTFASSTLW